MKDTYKIFSYLDNVTEAYAEPISRVPGLLRNPKDIIRTIEFYSDNEYMSGNTDELGREKPFYNVCNYRVTTAKTATDLDVKDIKFEPDSLKFSVQAMIMNRILFQYLKESKFSMFLNDFGYARPKYGHAIAKKSKEEGKLKIDVVDMTNINFNPKNVMGGIIDEVFYLQPSELAEKMDVYDNVDEVLKYHDKLNKGKPADIEVHEVTGDFPEAFYPDNEDNVDYVDSGKYAEMCFTIAYIGKKKFILYYEYEKEGDDKFKALAWEKRGDGFGRGVVEDGFQAQIWQNDAMISMKNAMDISGKVLLTTDSQKVNGNAITGVDNGHIFQIEAGRSISSLNLAPSALPQFERMIELWNQQYNNVASVHDANTGEAPTAGTPYSQTALLNQVANSPFEFRREEYGIFINEILNDWIYPELMKIAKKKDFLVSEFDNDELDLIDESIANYRVNTELHKILLANTGELPTPEMEAQMKQDIIEQLKKKGNKREIELPEGFLDVKGKLTANITGELKNKGAILQSLDSIFKTVVSTFNPQTGTYAALDNPALAKVFGSIVEMSGVPFSAGSLRGSSTAMATPTGTVPTSQPTAPVAATPMAGAVQ